MGWVGEQIARDGWWIMGEGLEKGLKAFERKRLKEWWKKSGKRTNCCSLDG